MKNVFTGILAKGYAVCRQEHGVHVSTTPSVRGCQGAHCVPQTSYADVLTLSTSAVVVVESLSHVRLFVTPWTATCQASLSFTIFWSLLKLMSIESVMPSNHLILCHPLLLPSIFPSIRIFISLLSRGLSRVFFSTTVSKHQFFSTQPSLWSSSHICT